MIVQAIYHGRNQVRRVYHNGQIIFQNNSPIEFHLLEDGKLIIVGALMANQLPDGVYIDCAPDWIYPVLEGNVLTIEQVYSAKMNGNVLEVE